MRKQFHDLAEKARLHNGPLASKHGDLFGFFLLRSPRSPDDFLKALASNGSDWRLHGLPLPAWEHVSVSLPSRCPTWDEMQYIKNLFWEPEEWVVQFNPAASEHRNLHPFCLHMWAIVGQEFPRPPAQCVAPDEKVKVVIKD